MSGARGGSRLSLSFTEVVVAGCIGAVIAVAASVRWFEARERAKVALAVGGLGRVARAVEAYYVDHEVYPACGSASGPRRVYAAQQIWQPTEAARIASGVPTANSFASPVSGAARLVTFRVGGARGLLATITTPVAYVPGFESDPFAGTRGASFGYFAHESRLGFILFSLGPDRDESATHGPGQISPQVERLYDISTDFPYMWRPAAALTGCAYDPSNGLRSAGDIYTFQGQ